MTSRCSGAPGYANAFEATYTTFGKIVHDQYPNDVPSFPAASEVLNTCFLEHVLAAERAPVDVRIETPAYVTVAGVEPKYWSAVVRGRSSSTPARTAPPGSERGAERADAQA